MAKLKRTAHAEPPRRAPRTGPNTLEPAADRSESPALDLGRTARRLRESQNLTLADIAGRANISSAMLSSVKLHSAPPLATRVQNSVLRVISTSEFAEDLLALAASK